MKKEYFFFNSASYISFQGFTLNIKEMNVTDNMEILKEKGYKAPKPVITEDSIMKNTHLTGYRMSTEVCCPVLRSD